MEQKKNKNKKTGLLTGFTLVEMLVVLAIISLLSSIVFVGVQGFRAKARDARRISDLNQIRTALVMYNTTYGNWIQADSGCGSRGNGNGWFNGVYTGYNKIVQCLITPGFLSAEIIDPTGGMSGSTPTNNVYTYMKYSCTQSGVSVTYMFAKLETKPQDINATNGTCCSTCDSNYGMNYYLKVQ